MGRIGLGGPRGSFRVRVGVSVRFSVSVGVSVVDCRFPSVWTENNTERRALHVHVHNHNTVARSQRLCGPVHSPHCTSFPSATAPVSQYRVSPVHISPGGDMLLLKSPPPCKCLLPHVEFPLLCKTLRSRRDKIAPVTESPPYTMRHRICITNSLPSIKSPLPPHIIRTLELT